MTRCRLLPFLLMGILPMLPLSVAAEENICPNPGFEQGGGADGPARWEGTKDHVTWDDQVAHSGKRSAKVTSDGGKTVGWTSDLIPLPRPGCRLVLEGWAKLENVSEGGGALMVLYTRDKKGDRNGQTGSIPIVPPSGGSLMTPWTHYVALGDVFKPDVHSVRVNVRLYKAKGAAWFDDMTVRLYQATDITTPRPIRYEINMVKEGKPLAAIVPATEGKGCAEEIQKAIQDATGATIPIEQPSSINLADERRDLILLGNLENNPCVEYLYCRSYTYEDRYYPGGGGCVVRPLLNILGTGANLVVIGATDEAGLKKGVGEFAKVIRESAAQGNLSPKLRLVVHKGEGYKGTRFFPWPGSSPYREMGPAADWLKDGDAKGAEQYREMVLKDWFIPDEQLFAEDHSLHLSYTTKTQSWDVMESSGVFSDEERLRVTRRLLDMMRSRQGYEYGGLAPGMRSRENHGIRAAKGFYWGWRYFKKYYAKELGTEVDLWGQRLRGFWEAPFGSARSFEDSLSQHAFSGSLDNTLTIGFCEPEWSRNYFAKSYAHKMGERCIAVCNNLGEVVAQGDTGSSDYPADVFAKLAYKFRDGRYLYVLRKRRLGSSSDDPFQGYVTRLEPKVPTDHIGVRVIPGDEAFYDSVHKQSTNVPLEKTFDKLTFRAGFEEDDAYLMLDGVAGGSHSYDDANTIGEFSQHGRIWLCQEDQFNGPTMNFHNAVTVARDGLGMVKVPGCAELVTACQGKDFGYTATALREYNGVDWIRHIFWLKGQFFFVLDELRAREEGGYSFVCGWRGLGEPKLEAGLYSVSEDVSLMAKLRFTAEQLQKSVGKTSGKTLRYMDVYDSILYRAEEVGDFAETKINVPEKGDYEMVLTGLQFTGRGTIQISVDGKPCGAPIDQFREGAPLIVQTPLGLLHFDAPGEHTIRFEVVGKRPDQKTCQFAIRSLDLFRPGEREGTKESVSRGFRLRFPSDVAAGLDRDTEVLGPYVNAHPWHDQALNILTESRAGQMAKDETISFQNLFWSVRGEDEGFDLRRMNEHCAVIASGDRVALLGGGEQGTEVTVDGLRLGAQFFYLDAERYILVRPRVLQIGGTDLGIDIGKESIEGTWANDGQRQTVSQAIAKAWKSAGVQVSQKGDKGEAALPEMKARWSKELPADALCIEVRGKGEGRSIAVGGGDGAVREFRADGSPLGEFKTEKPVHALCACDLNRDGVDELLVGSDDEHVYALNAKRNVLWKHQVPFLREEQIWMWWTLGSSKVRRIVADDVNADGAPEIIVGAGNMRLNVLDSKGEHLWRFRTDHGIPTTIITADLLGKGRKDDILCGNGLLSSNGTCWVLDGKGKLLKSFYNDSWCTTLPAIAVGDPDGDGKVTLFCGNNRGNLRAYDPNGDQRTPLWIHNLAGTIWRIVIAPREGADEGLVVAASDSGCLTAFRQNGEKAWVATLGAAVVAADLTPDKNIAAGCKDGTIFLVSPQGKPFASFQTGEQLQDLRCDENGDLIAITKRHLWRVIGVRS